MQKETNDGMVVTIDEGELGEYFNRYILPYARYAENPTATHGGMFTWMNIIGVIYFVWNQYPHRDSDIFVDDVIMLMEEVYDVNLDTFPELLKHVTTVIHGYRDMLALAIGNDYIDRYEGGLLFTRTRQFYQKPLALPSQPTLSESQGIGYGN